MHNLPGKLFYLLRPFISQSSYLLLNNHRSHHNHTLPTLPSTSGNHQFPPKIDSPDAAVPASATSASAVDSTNRVFFVAAASSGNLPHLLLILHVNSILP